MPANRQRYAQAFPLTYICIGIAVLVCFVSFSVKALLIKQQLKQDGERLVGLLKEQAKIETDIQRLETEKKKLISPPALIKAIAEKFIKLVEIDEHSVFQVDRVRRGVAAADSRPAPEEGR